MVMKREGNGSNPGGGKCFSARLSFERNSSDISRFMFVILIESEIKSVVAKIEPIVRGTFIAHIG